MSRQRGFYHKCHRCVFQGRPADFVPETPSGANGVASENGRVPRDDESVVGVLPAGKSRR